MTLESSQNQKSFDDNGRAYDLERTYCIIKQGMQPVRTICDALLMQTANGIMQVETWVPLESTEWMLSDEHIASTAELDELVGYLRCITGVS